MRACFTEIVQTCGCGAGPENRSVLHCVSNRAYIRTNEKTPTRCKRGAIDGKRSVLRFLLGLQVMRHLDGSTVDGDCDRVSAPCSREQRRALSDDIDYVADVKPGFVDLG